MAIEELKKHCNSIELDAAEIARYRGKFAAQLPSQRRSIFARWFDNRAVVGAVVLTAMITFTLTSFIYLKIDLVNLEGVSTKLAENEEQRQLGQLDQAPLEMSDSSTPMLINIGQAYTVYSELYQTELNLFVQLPVNYQRSNSSYEVIYITDGEFHFGHAVYASSILQLRDLMPESIIVGIPLLSPSRNSDFDVQSDKFNQFISEEVIEFIDGNFRTLARRTIFGHSQGANFVLNLFLENDAQFDAYILASPRISESTRLRMQSYLEQAEVQVSYLPGKSLYITYAEQDQESTNVMQELGKMLAEGGAENLRWQTILLPNLTHMTTPYATIYSGLAFINKQDDDFKIQIEGLIR